jgi:hypothetical protein
LWSGGKVAPPRPSTNESKTRFVVAAIPADARTADLVVRDAGITQRLSILTGVPGKNTSPFLRVLPLPCRERRRPPGARSRRLM